MSSGGENFEENKARIAFAVALSHLIDLDGFLRLMERAVSPQALIEGFTPAQQATLADWAEAARVLKALRETSLGVSAASDREVLDEIERRLSAALRKEEPKAD